MSDQTTTEADDIEDIAAANREGQAVRPARSYRVAVADERLAFRPLAIDDPLPLGRQILAAAGYQPPDEYLLLAVLPSGDFEDVRPDEPFDLRARGAERFVVFRADRLYRFTLNGRDLRWGLPSIRGAALYALANENDPDDRAVFLDARGGEDRQIEPDDVVALSAAGTERFVTTTRTFNIVVNARPKTVTGRVVMFEQVVQLAFPGTHDPNVVFDMTYSKAASTPPAGLLGQGGSIRVKNGTIFDVTRTVQS